MHKLEELMRMMPEGNWKLGETDGEFNLLDPEGNVVKIKDLPPVQRKLYLDLFAQFMTRVPYLLYDLGMERNRTEALFKELRHVKGRVRESYARGVTDSVGVIENMEVNTIAGRNALVTASESIAEQLYD